MVVQYNLYKNSSKTLKSKSHECHLGLVTGTESLSEQYIKKKVEDWVKDLQLLSNYTQDHPQAAHSAFTKGLYASDRPISKEQY